MVGRLCKDNTYVRRGDAYRIAGSNQTDCCCSCVQELFLREPVIRFTRNARTYTSGDDGNYEPCNIWGVPSTYDVGFAITYGPYTNRSSVWCQFLEDDSELDLTLSADPAFDYTFEDLRTFPTTYSGINPSPSLHDIRAQELFQSYIGNPTCTAGAIAGWTADSFTAWHIEELTPYGGWTGFGEWGPSCIGTESTRGDCPGGSYSTFYTATVNKIWRIVRAEFVGSRCSTHSVSVSPCDIGSGLFTAIVTDDNEFICIGPSDTDYTASMKVSVVYLETVTYTMPDIGFGTAATLTEYFTEYNPRGYNVSNGFGFNSMRKGSYQTYAPRTPTTTGYWDVGGGGGTVKVVPNIVTRTYTEPNAAATFTLAEEPSYDANTAVLDDDILTNAPCQTIDIDYFWTLDNEGLRPHCLHIPADPLTCSTWAENEPEEFSIASLELS